MSFFAPFPHPMLGRSSEIMLAETTALLARMSVQPSSGRKSIINNLIGSLKTAGLWTKLDFLYLIAAHDAQAARLNWKAAAYDITLSGTPTFLTDRHYATDGSTNYLTTNYQPSSNGAQWTLNSAQLSVWVRDATTTSSGSGFSNSSNDTTVNPNNGSQYVGRVNGSAALSLSGATTSVGLTGFDRPDASNLTGYRNGASLGSGAAASTALTAGVLRLGSNSVSSFAHQYSAAAAGAHLTASEHLALYNALQTYMTALGA